MDNTSNKLKTSLDHVDAQQCTKAQASVSSASEPEVSLAKRVMAACAGSLVNAMVSTPFDVVRVRLQLQECVTLDKPLDIIESSFPNSCKHTTGGSTNLGVTACCRDVFSMPSSVDYCVVSPFDECAVSTASIGRSSNNQRILNGTFQGLAQIARFEGYSALWRGLSPTLVMTIPANVIYFVGYDYLRTKVFPIQNGSSSSTMLVPLVAGGVARTLASTAVSPLEMFRTRIQSVASSDSRQRTAREAFRLTFDGMRGMVHAEGVGSLWRGLGFTLWRDVPFSAVYWACYEHTRGLIERYKRSRDSRASNRAPSYSETFVEAFTAGAASGSFAAFVTTPFDVGKTRRQVLQNKDPKLNRMSAILLKVANEEGIQGLFRGLGPRVLKVSVSCAIMISFYEFGKKLWMPSSVDKFGERIEEEIIISSE
ncbi:mitochondrial carrier domain-containing protein [Dipodascopsis uninucleata]